ncbi:MAG: hypothetical protein IJW84_02250 [Alphaproteobacteria bacterium]|nr:hypothetical protein [Alphaproteobacteria bacterium]
MTPKQELIKSTEELIKKSQDSERVSRVVGYGGVAIGGACMLAAIAMAIRENYDWTVVNGLVGALNLYLGGANIQCAKTCRGNIQKLIKSKQALEKIKW